MNDDMEEKRKEKIEHFKLHISDEFPANESLSETGINDNSSTASSNDEEEHFSRRDKIENFKIHIDESDSAADGASDSYGSSAYSYEIGRAHV